MLKEIVLVGLWIRNEYIVHCIDDFHTIDLDVLLNIIH